MRKTRDPRLFFILPLLASVALEAGLALGAQPAAAAGCPTYWICAPAEKRIPAQPVNNIAPKKKNSQTSPKRK